MRLWRSLPLANECYLALAAKQLEKTIHFSSRDQVGCYRSASPTARGAPRPRRPHPSHRPGAPEAVGVAVLAAGLIGQ